MRKAIRYQNTFSVDFNQETGQSCEILHDELQNMTLLGNLSETMVLKRKFVTIVSAELCVAVEIKCKLGRGNLELYFAVTVIVIEDELSNFSNFVIFFSC